MKRSKFTEHDFINKCNELCLEYVGYYMQKKKGSTVKYICPIHKDKGVQEADFSHFKNYTIGCKYCSGRCKTTKDILPHIENKDVVLLSEYNRYEEKIKCQCKQCGNIWEARPSVILHGGGCPKCGKIKASKGESKTHDEFIREMQTKNDNIDIIGTYINYKASVKCKCKIDGFIWDGKPATLLNGTAGCPECTRQKMYKKFRKSKVIFEQQAKEANPNVILIGEYINSTTKIKCKCAIHGTQFECIPPKLLNGQISCPLCQNYNKTESKVYDILEKRYSNVQRQKTFIDCRDHFKLRFDFFVEEINALIEYDGEQHYWPVPFGNMSDHDADVSFDICKKHDAIKEEYCKNNNISLIRIPYWEKNNLENYIDYELSKILYYG